MLDELSGDAVDLVEITGVVKWFEMLPRASASLSQDNGMQDVLLHVTCLRRDGYQTILEGTRIVALIQRRERGYEAFEISLHGPVDRRPSVTAAAGAHPRAGHPRRAASSGHW